MKMRTRMLPKLLNSEVEQYLSKNDVIIVPVGTVEMHGGFPLDCETAVSEAVALRMAEECDGLILPHLPYFYAGGTATGRGTVQVSVRQGIDYLSAIAHSLLRQGFKRQIYISFHAPAYLTCSPMIRDFFDETGIPILYIDLTARFFHDTEGMQKFIESFHAIIAAGYDILGRLEDIPLTSEFFHTRPQTTAPFSRLFSLAQPSGSIGYCFGAPEDHMSTPSLLTSAARQELADRGRPLLNELVQALDMPKLVADMYALEQFEQLQGKRFPWLPFST